MSDSEAFKPKTDVEIRKVLEEKQPNLAKLILSLSDKFLGGRQEKSKEEKLALLTDEQREQLIEIEGNAVAGFLGQLNELESALGMLILGHHVGWKVLYLIHSKKTIRNYEDILGIRIRDIFPEEGPSSYRSNGLRIAKKTTNFWKVVSGEEKIENKKLIE